jgi:hypothetical protein
VNDLAVIPESDPVQPLQDCATLEGQRYRARQRLEHENGEDQHLRQKKRVGPESLFDTVASGSDERIRCGRRLGYYARCLGHRFLIRSLNVALRAQSSQLFHPGLRWPATWW